MAGVAFSCLMPAAANAASSTGPRLVMFTSVSCQQLDRSWRFHVATIQRLVYVRASAQLAYKSGWVTDYPSAQAAQLASASGSSEDPTHKASAVERN